MNGTVVDEPKVRNQANYRIYKSRKTGDGAASSWQLTNKASRRNKDVQETYLFLSLAKQTGFDDKNNAKFDWKIWDRDAQQFNDSTALSFKLGLSDMGEVLSVIHGVKKNAGTEKGVFHENDKGNTILNFSVWEKEGFLQGYNLKLSNKLNDSKDFTSISHSVSVAEAEVLRVLLQNAILQMSNWQL